MAFVMSLCDACAVRSVAAAERERVGVCVCVWEENCSFMCITGPAMQLHNVGLLIQGKITRHLRDTLNRLVF